MRAATTRCSWLEYSHLQLGDEAEAARLLADMRADEQEHSSKRTRSHLVSMRAAYVVALEAWDDEAARFEVDLDELDPAFACAELYVRGRAALARGDTARAERLSAAMAEQRGPLETLVAEGASAAACCAPATRANYLPGRLAAHVMELELEGLIALAGGAEEEGLARLAEAAAQEDAMGFDYGPPVVVEPVHELLGCLLLERGRRADAAIEFEAALQRAPGRLRSLQGLASAKSDG